VVQLQHVVVDQPLDRVEEPPADREPAGERAAGPRDVATRAGPEEKPDAERGDEPRHGVKDAVPDHVDLDVHQRRRRKARRQHVMQLQDLVKQDAVREASEPDAEHGPRRDERSLGRRHRRPR